MDVPFKKYIVWQCPGCGNWCGKQNYKWAPGMNNQTKLYAIEKMTLKCSRCNRSTKLRNKEKGGVRTKHYWCDHPGTATQIIQKMQDMKSK